VCKSLEKLSTIEDSDKLTEQSTSSTPDEHLNTFTPAAFETLKSTVPGHFTTLRKLRSTSTPSGLLARDAAEYDYSARAESVKCEEFNNTNIPVPATDGEPFHTPSQAQITECSNKHKNTDTSTTKVHSAKDQENKTDFDGLPSDNKPSPEESVLSIIKNHQEAIR
jgi:hypothetical protein